MLDVNALIGWLRPLRPMSPDLQRLATAACLLSDIGWLEHPDYRSEQAYLRALRMPFGGIVNLSYVEQDGYQTERAGHTAVTASFQWFAASALKIRSVDRETRWR